ncbi:MAG TPA: NAD(P)/FAD-dependent oxidoreductase [Solirubrobacterales bacterium]
MATTDSSPRIIADRADYDAVVVGASLAGCTTAILLARQGVRVALVEKSPDPDSFKRICSHFIQASAVPTLERLGLLDPILAAGGLRSRFRMWTRWGWVTPHDDAAQAVNLRRSLLDPLVRNSAAQTPGVDLALGHRAVGLLRDGDAVAGVVTRDPAGGESRLRAKLVVGADGRDSKLAELAGVPERVLPHGRFAYGGYFEGEAPRHAPDASVWMLDPNWGAAFPTDNGLTFYAAMPTKDRLAEFKRDPGGALVAFLDGMPEAPPIRSGRPVEPILGKVEMPNRVRRTTAPGLALVGDAALALDPLFGIGCGWALQSGEWLADSVVPALHGEEPLARGLRRYGRAHKRHLSGHARMINDYATGRKMNRGERAIFAAAARDRKVAQTFDRFGSRQIGPARMLTTALPRAVVVNLRHNRADQAASQPPRTGEPAAL